MATRKSEKYPIVILGASAGGLENYQAILKKISPKNNFIYVVIQHLDPKHKSQLAMILKKSTSMPVLEIENGMKPEINQVYVLPSNAEVKWQNDVFKLAARAKGTKNEFCTIDVFLLSLSKEKDRRHIGVLLSGSNTDGTKGLRSLKKTGGMTLALDPATTQFPIMPQSAISKHVVDQVFPIERMGNEINKLSKQTSIVVKDEEENILTPLFDLLELKTGVDFSQYKQATLQRRINRRMQLTKKKTLPAYVSFLKKNPTELKKLFEEVTIHVTDFFRDPDSFEALKTKIIPKIVANTTKKPVRVWVPACSTGQEAYSTAMYLLDYAETIRSKAVIQIFATDVSEDSIKKARTGAYSAEEVKKIPLRLLKKYFNKTSTGFVVSKDLRNACIFAKHDLACDASFSQMDLVCCRNLLIYFNPQNQKKAIQTFNYALKPGGFLFLGHEESLGSMDKLFTVVDRKNSLFKKSESYSVATNSKVRNSHGDTALKLKRGISFLSRSDHEDFIKIAKKFNDQKVVNPKETPAKANVRLNKEMKQIRAYFERLVENQSAIYEELQATHEEVLASNEELQIKNEDFETSQEELQATNEELRSINDEMVDRNLELVKLNEEIANSEMLISEEKDYSKAIVDTIREPIIVLDEKLNVQSVNLPFLTAFKVSSDETIGSSLFMLGNNQWDIPELKKALLGIISRQSSFKDFEIEHDFPRIGKKIISLNARQLTLPHSDKKLILLAMEDITLKAMLKERMKDSVKSLEFRKGISDASVLRLEEEKTLRERFVSALTHDLKNPLSAAMMAAQLVGRNVEDPAKVAKLSFRIINSLHRVDTMISDLLDANQIQAGEEFGVNIQHFDAQVVLHQTFEELISVYGDRFNLIEHEPLFVDCDPNGLRRIIENLVSNAIKYGDLNSKIKISIAMASKGWFELNVQNFGSLIELKDLTKIFQQFGRTDSAQKSKKIGWGIGLTLVKGITHALGGQISVSSNEVEGTNFKVRLPVRYVGKQT